MQDFSNREWRLLGGLPFVFILVFQFGIFAAEGIDLKDGEPWQNSLGMKFCPIPDRQVLFGIYDVRVKDFEAFVAQSGYIPEGVYQENDPDGKPSGDWKKPGFKQSADDPVVDVSWDDAMAFCAWLTGKERADGTLKAEQEYRLPTDDEWSQAAGPGVYPWGNQWPPPKDAANFAGEEVRAPDWPTNLEIISGYNDSFPRTSPVGSFLPNVYGLYDMSGNVWQWCMDWFGEEIRVKDPEMTAGPDGMPFSQNFVEKQYVPDEGKTHRILRGSSWQDGLDIKTSARDYAFPGTHRSTIGFRIVLVVR
ncbi:MAG: SUMF1/EgtB/PvdO family nonheme iron enzyme [Verrucomicrobium sp.]|nr:SUMF1/EgtB/PvdO family nonheme iron enzyme [Verrucomicrobium sp.]